MNKKALTIALVAAAAVGAIIYLQRRNTSVAAGASNVTATTKGGVNTTPIQGDALAIVAAPFRAITDLARRVINMPASIIPGGAPDRLQPYGDKRTAAAAYNAPIRPDYAPTIRARDNIVFIR